MRIALGQINTRVGDLARNTEKILDWIGRARGQQADLIVFPELTIVGYPPEDLVEREALIRRNLVELDRVRQASSGIGVICGFVSPNETGQGRKLFNSAALMENGRVIGIQHKSLLPNYDVFDEVRHFEPAGEKHVFRFRDRTIGLSICEDTWNDKDFWKRRLYPSDPIETLAGQGADLMINISASPFHTGKPEFRVEMFRSMGRKFRVPSVFVNLVGGNDSLVFDGSSFVMDGEKVTARCRQFDEELLVVDLERPSEDDGLWSRSEEEQIYRALVLGLGDYVRKCGFESALIGLSGGIDSAVVAAVAVEAMGAAQVTGVAMPSPYSSDHSLADARRLVSNLGIRYMEIPIEPVFEAYLQTLEEPFKGRQPDITEENIQARIRGNLLMALSNKFGSLVLSTGNKSELAVGYCTIYGDMAGGLAVISDVPKTTVYRLARWINREREIIPGRTITKPPSAELRPNQKDQDSLPPYEVLDGILQLYIEELKEEDEIVRAGYEPAIVRSVLKLVDRNEYKRRQAAPGLRVTTKAFGFGRRIPIAQGWR